MADNPVAILQAEVNAVKREVEEMRQKGADKVLVAALSDLDRRVTNIEMFLSDMAKEKIAEKVGS